MLVAAIRRSSSITTQSSISSALLQPEHLFRQLNFFSVSSPADYEKLLEGPEYRRFLADCHDSTFKEALKKFPFRIRRRLEAAAKAPFKKKKKRPPPGPVQFEDLTAREPGHSDLSFAFMHSYTETPKVTPLRIQDEFSPFGPGRLDRHWDGVSAYSTPPDTLPPSVWRKPKRVGPYIGDSLKRQYPKPGPLGVWYKRTKTREQILGAPLTAEEIKDLVDKNLKTRKQLNLGRDGLTHNMLNNIHNFWRRERVIRIKCKGVPTVDMENVMFQLQDKTGGKIVHRHGGTIYLFRGRHYHYKMDRPFIPPMLWKPHSAIYPKLVTQNPGGLDTEDAKRLRRRGRSIMPLCRLGKNGYYADLVKHVRDAFQDDNLVRIDCRGMNTSDYKKIGAKLKELVPCVLLSFAREQILIWDGKNLYKPLSVDLSTGSWSEDDDINACEPPVIVSSLDEDSALGDINMDGDFDANSKHPIGSNDDVNACEPSTVVFTVFESSSFGDIDADGGTMYLISFDDEAGNFYHFGSLIESENKAVWSSDEIESC